VGAYVFGWPGYDISGDVPPVARASFGGPGGAVGCGGQCDGVGNVVGQKGYLRGISSSNKAVIPATRRDRLQVAWCQFHPSTIPEMPSIGLRPLDDGDNPLILRSLYD
jgi:hypothetical protein